MTTFADITRTLRRRLGDRPDRTRITNVGGINAAAGSCTIPTGHVSLKFPRSQLFVDFDDGTLERAWVDSAASDTDTLTLLRGQDGTTGIAHALNTWLLIDARFPNQQLYDVLSEIVASELWPWVWVPKETTLAYEADGNYSPTATDIESVSFAYQLLAGQASPLDVDFISPEQADNANFPNGMILLPYPVDASTVYVAYRSRADLSVDGSGNFLNFPAEIQSLATIATLAQLMMEEETELEGPSASALDRQIQAGSRQRAGALLWDRFKERRAAKMGSLQEDERQRFQLVPS